MHNETVVVVDDDSETREMFGLVLTAEGYQTTLCADAEDAYPLIRRAQPRLVVLDLIWGGPEVGWQMLLLLRRERRTADIPVLLCAGTDDFLCIRGRLVRMLHGTLLEKPFHLVDLLAEVERALRPERMPEWDGGLRARMLAG